MMKTPLMIQRKQEQPQCFATQNVIQRSIGFELEIGPYSQLFDSENRMYEKNRRFNAGNPMTQDELDPDNVFKKGKVMVECPMFDVTVDVSYKDKIPYVEIITRAFPETELGWEMLNTAMQEIEGIGDMIAFNCYHHAFLGHFWRFGKVEPEYKRAIFLCPDKPTGFFHVTAGVDMKKIPELFSDLAYPDDDEFEKLGKRREQGREFLMPPKKDEEDPLESHAKQLMLADVNRAVDELKNTFAIVENPALEGLLLMIGFYLYQSIEEVQEYPKSFTALLSRTDFSRQFSILPRRIQALLSDNDFSLWLDITGGLNDLLGCGALSQPFFARGTDCYFEDDERSRRMCELSREEWLENIPKGKDLLTSRNYPNRKHANGLGALGAMGGMTDSVGSMTREHGSIIEFRNTKQPLTHKEWKPFAQKAFKYIYALNKGLGKKYGEDFKINRDTDVGESY
ncbi:hypothetical protein [Aureibacter tunicatorum]|uniref:Uncharacterized protein n=1 Tax=Aureibacter tunicatorum TaxID=866807 RepID=A0AAE3XRM5_9BACT|nr:hypothetical protein [Aureibacter tunicatorum]MDR6240675.1 hypothetical protein [Aureibacter tunicatorum]